MKMSALTLAAVLALVATPLVAGGAADRSKTDDNAASKQATQDRSSQSERSFLDALFNWRPDDSERAIRNFHRRKHHDGGGR